MRVALTAAFFALLATSASATPMFAPAVNFAVGPAPRAVVLADVSGDGAQDVITAGSSGVSVLVNTSTGTGLDPPPTFAPVVTFAAGSDPSSVAVGDLNGDIRPDLAVANRGSSTVSVFLNTHVEGGPDVSFSGPFNHAVGSAPSSVAVGDVNRDGSLDLVTANSGSATGDDGVSVLRSTTPQFATTPSFAPALSLDAGPNPSSVAVRGLERFVSLKSADIVTANGGSVTGTAGVSLLRNTTPSGSATLSFDPPVQMTSGPSPSAVAVTTFYDLVKPSIVVANGGSTDGTDGVSVFENTTPGTSDEYTFAAKEDFDSGDAPSAVTAALDADWETLERMDLVTADAGATDGASVLVSAMTDSTPSFAAPFALTAGSDPSGIAFDAVNTDVAADVVVANRGSSNVSILGHHFDDPKLLSAPCSPPGTQTSWSSTEHTTETPVELVEDVYSTRVVGRGPGGAIVFDQTTPDPPGSPAVTALGDAARAALVQAYGAGASISDLTLESSSDVVGPRTEYGGFGTNEWTHTTDFTQGPATILVGEEQSETLFIPDDCDNLNMHGHRENFVLDASLATATHSATYARVATPDPGPSPDPSPDPPGPVPGPGPLLPPALPTLPQNPSPAACTANRLVLTDVFPAGGRTRILGVAPTSAAGKRVAIRSAWNGRTVARAVVAADLSFRATVPLPPGRLRNRTPPATWPCSAARAASR